MYSFECMFLLIDFDNVVHIFFHCLFKQKWNQYTILLSFNPFQVLFSFHSLFIPYSLHIIINHPFPYEFQIIQSLLMISLPFFFHIVINNTNRRITTNNTDETRVIEERTIFSLHLWHEWWLMIVPVDELNKIRMKRFWLNDEDNSLFIEWMNNWESYRWTMISL